MPLNIIQNDITKLQVDAIVNAANTRLQMDGGVCGAIFSAAGAKQLQAACDVYAPIKTGEAVITPGFKLPAKYIIHTAGPVYQDGKQNEEALLRACYINSLSLAVKQACESIAFPLISGGFHGYPKRDALRVATDAIRDFLADHDITVSLVVFDKTAFEAGEELHGEVERYIDAHYIEERPVKERPVKKRPVSHRRPIYRKRNVLSDDELVTLSKQMSPMAKALPTVFEDMAVGVELDDLVGKLDEPFSATLLRLIDATGKKDSEVYHRANIDRRLFSKIRSNTDYAPSKPTVLAFAIALELDLKQTEDLLARAGFALSRSRKFDVIMEYFIENRKYDIYEINEVLFSYDQPLLGG